MTWEEGQEAIQRAEAYGWRLIQEAATARQMNTAERRELEWEARRLYLMEALQSVLSAEDHVELVRPLLARARESLVAELFERGEGVDQRREEGAA